MYTVPRTTTITSESVRAAIEANELQTPRRTKLHDYYLGKHAILSRKKGDVALKDNKIVVNHAKYITDVSIGYLLGNPVDYRATDETDISAVLQEYARLTVADIDSQVAKMVSVMGLAYEYLFVDEENLVQVVPLDPRNCVLVFDDTMRHSPLFAVIYGAKTKDGWEDVVAVDAAEIVHFGSRLQLGERIPHRFGSVPVVAYRNNPDELGDFEAVLSLIDAYNLLQSDRLNDKEQLVEAILVLKGLTMTAEQKRDLKLYRVLAMDKDAVAEYLTKQLNEEDTDILRQVIEADIHKISMTPNLADENFVGNASGVAIRYKLLAFEQSVMNKERWFERSLIQRFILVNHLLNFRDQSVPRVEPWQVDAIFKRNLPSNDLEISTMIANLEGLVSRETLVGQLGFVDDASREIELAQEEAIPGEFGTPVPTGLTDPELRQKILSLVTADE